MIVELTPDTYFQYVRAEGPLHVVMHYGVTCGPCKITMPYYEIVYAHFIEHKITNVKFHKFHQWEQTYKPFIQENNLTVNGVPTFKYFYFGEVLAEYTQSFNDANVLKQNIIGVVKLIESNFGEFNLYAS